MSVHFVILQLGNEFGRSCHCHKLHNEASSSCFTCSSRCNSGTLRVCVTFGRITDVVLIPAQFIKIGGVRLLHWRGSGSILVVTEHRPGNPLLVYVYFGLHQHNTLYGKVFIVGDLTRCCRWKNTSYALHSSFHDVKLIFWPKIDTFDVLEIGIFEVAIFNCAQIIVFFYQLLLCIGF